MNSDDNSNNNKKYDEFFKDRIISCNNSPADIDLWNKNYFDVCCDILEDNSIITNHINLEKANFSRFILKDISLEHANLKGADLHDANFEGADLHDANLDRANLNHANFEGANLSNASLKNTTLFSAYFSKETDIRNANFEGSDIEDFINKFHHQPICRYNQHQMLKNHAKLNNIQEWENWRKKNKNTAIYLQCADLRNTNLEGVDLKSARLEGADLSDANLRNTNLSGAYFSKETEIRNANFEGSDIEYFINKFHHLPICNYDQYVMLKNCARHKNIEEWNSWRKKNGNIAIYLQRANLRHTNLEMADFIGANLEMADFIGANLEEANFDHANLEGAKLSGTNFEGSLLKNVNLKDTYLKRANFINADLTNANINGSKLENSNFENANLSNANLENTTLKKINLKEARLRKAKLNGAYLKQVNFEDAKLTHANLQETSIIKSNLEQACFRCIKVNGSTIIHHCSVDENTDFTTVAIDSARVEPSLLAALKTNLRRISWGNYYEEKGEILTLPIRFFWWLSDYGSSSVRIGLCILIATLFFTDVYLALAKINLDIFTLPDTTSALLIYDQTFKNFITDFFTSPNKTNLLLIGAPFHDYIRVLCFAISTMVTLGFGGINIKIISGHNWLSTSAFVFVTLNLISGYLFLSVLVTRLGILFQSQAPEQKAKETNNTILYFVALILFVLGSYMLFCWEDIIGFINYAALITVLFGMGYFHFK